jgi:hypothetical protein
MITGINGALGAVVTIIFIYFFLDRVGRKPPLILGNSTPTNNRLKLNWSVRLTGDGYLAGCRGGHQRQMGRRGFD